MNVSRHFPIACLVTLVASCAQLEHTARPLSTSSSDSLDRCEPFGAMTDKEAASKLDQADIFFARLKAATGKTNAQICAMNSEEIAKVMLAERNKLRDQNRRRGRKASTEWVRTWDIDDNGLAPTSAQFIAADAQRKRLTETASRSRSGEARVTLAAGISSAQWSSIGPGNVGGRLRAIVIDPRDARRIYLGAATGGVWLSENAGQSFLPLTDSLPNLAIGALALDPINPNVLYAGTGESFQGFTGMGVFKSTNGGVSWSFLNGTSTDTATNSLGQEWGFVNRLAISPANPNLVLAATTRITSTLQGAIMRSTDGGQSWARIQLAAGSLVTGSNSNFGNANPPAVMDLRFDPNNANNVVAGAANGHIYYSRDAGATWAQTAALPTALKGSSSSARAELAYAKSRPNLIYASLDNIADDSTARGEVWKSEDGGATWTFLSAPKHLNVQGEYDNTIWVDPTNENHIVVGGLDLYQSQDGGMSFTKISDRRLAGTGQPQPHADQHQIVSVPNFSSANPVVYFGNDGGLFRANNIFSVGATGTTSWQNLNNGLAVTQFYGGAGARAAGGKIIGGTQDNGALQFFEGTSWFRTAGGDGGFAAVDPVDDSTIYGEYVYAAVHRRMGEGSLTYICNGITEAYSEEGANPTCGAGTTEEANFIAPFVLDPNDRNRMLVGANSLWVSDNVKATTPSWRAILGPGGTKAQRRFINAIAVYARDSNVIWVGRNGGQLWKTTDGLSANPNWTQVTFASLPTSNVNRVTIDPDNPNRVWVAYSGFSSARIWTTTDGGNTWTNIHNNLPNVTMHDIKRHPTQANWLYVAAANGVYASENAGQTWSATNDGPNGVRVRELFWYDPSTLIAATFGRGMFRATVAGGGPANYTDIWWSGQTENGWGVTINQHGNIQFNTLFVYDSTGKATWYAMPGCTWNADFTACNGGLYKPTSSRLDNYNTMQFLANPPVGSVTFQYTGPNNALMQYVINGQAGQKQITRNVFGPVDNTPGLQVGDMWWAGESQNGWGVAITQQYRTLFAAWYTYDPNGQTTWYTLPGGAWNGNVYSGKLYTATSSPWVGVPYNAGAFVAQEVGTISFNFSNANTATMTYAFTAGPYAGTTQTKSITRLPF